MVGSINIRRTGSVDVMGMVSNRPELVSTVWLREDSHSPIRFRGHGHALDILSSPLAQFFRRLNACTQELCAGVLGKHAFTEGAELLPLKPTILRRVSNGSLTDV